MSIDLTKNLNRPTIETETIQISGPRTIDLTTPSASPVRLPKHQIIEFWENGLLNPLAYVLLAIEWEKLNTEKATLKIDIDNFIHEWAGTVDPDTGKGKKLTKRQLIGAILTIEEKTGEELITARIEVDVQMELLS